VEVKATNQSKKLLALMDTFIGVEAAILAADIRNELGEVLDRVDVRGVLPEGMTRNELLEAFGKLPTAPGARSLRLRDGGFLYATFAWGPTRGTFAVPDQLRNLRYHLDTAATLSRREGNIKLLVLLESFGVPTRANAGVIEGLRDLIQPLPILGLLAVDVAHGDGSWHFRRSALADNGVASDVLAALESIPERFVLDLEQVLAH
jgi:hypothetical protein